MIHFSNAIAFVESIPASTAFYRDVIGIAPTFESETFVLFANGFSIHDGDALHEASFDRSREPGSSWGRDNVDYYFIADDVDAEFARIRESVRVVHPIRTLPHGERAFRCLDPDGHLLEIGDGTA